MAKKKTAVRKASPAKRRVKRASLAGRDLLTLTDITREDILDLFKTAKRCKANIKPFRKSLDGKTVVLLFEKASLRTRLSFETGIGLLGGRSIYMDHSAQRIGEREATKDYGRNLERWLDCVIARVYSQRAVEELAGFCDVPVINALSDRFHPCQGLADLFTLWERPGGLEGVRLAWVGDGNNVCHSLMHAASMLGVDMTVITPRGYEPAPEVVQECLAYAKQHGGTLSFSHDPAAVEGHHAVYTDVWVSMGQADQANERRAAFADYTVNAPLMALASKGVTGKRFPHGSLFMHCLPAQRGVEVTDEVIDSPASIVYDQAENRMHAQNALLIHLLGSR
jgi:ornithine carbamoyltransferase